MQKKAITANLRLLILEEDLKKIKKVPYKDRNKNKIYKKYSDLLFNTIKNISIPRDVEVVDKKDFDSLEDLESFNGES